MNNNVISVLSAINTGNYNNKNNIDLDLRFATYTPGDNDSLDRSLPLQPFNSGHLLWLMVDTVLYFRPTIVTLTEDGFVGRDLFDDEDALADHDPYVGSVLTSSKHINGAALILIPQVRKRILTLLDSSFYFCFTSVHEVMIHKCDPDIKPESIKEVVSVVNASGIVYKELILSDHVYICNNDEKYSIDIVL